MNARLTGTVLALTSATSFGVMPVLTKIVYRQPDVGPVGLLAPRFTSAALVLALLAVRRGERLPRGRPLAWLVGLGALGYAAQSACYFGALTRLGAGLTALLLYVYPALVVLLAAVALHTRPRPAGLACVALATVGTALTVGPLHGGQTLGIALGLGAALAYAGYIVVGSRVLAGVPPVAGAAVVMGAAGVVFDVAAVTTRAALPSRPEGLAALTGLVLVCTVVSVSTFFAALQRLGPADAAVLSTLEPVVSVLAAAVVLGERFGAVQALGGVLVLAAVVTLARLAPARDALQEVGP